MCSRSSEKCSRNDLASSSTNGDVAKNATTAMPRVAAKEIHNRFLRFALFPFCPAVSIVTSTCAVSKGSKSSAPVYLVDMASPIAAPANR